MTKLVLRWAVIFVAVLIAAQLLPQQVGYESVAGVAVFAAVLAMLNMFVKPVLRFISTPLSCLTLGLFVLVINAFLFWLAARLTGGESVWVNGPFGAFVGALIVSVVSMAVARIK